MTSYTPEELDFLHAVFDAARGGDTGSLSPLLAEGLTPDLTNARGDTLLILAAYHQHVDAVQLLLDHGADHSRVNDQGQTALGAAVFRRASAIVSALLRAGADPDAGLRTAREFAEFFQLDDMAAMLPEPVSPAGPRSAGPGSPGPVGGGGRSHGFESGGGPVDGRGPRSPTPTGENASTNDPSR